MTDYSKPWTPGEVDDLIDTPRIKRGALKPLSALANGIDRADSDTSFLPIIMVRKGALHLMADAVEHAMIAAETPFFVRGGWLMRPVVEATSNATGGQTMTARLVPVTENMILDYGSRAATWLKYDVRTRKDVPANMPPDVAGVVASRMGEYRFRRLDGIITVPTMRPDGTILATPGYDEQTRLLLIDPPPMPPIPDRPTHADAAAAINLLDGLLDGFPFVDCASRAVALSAIIGPVVRGALPTAPLHVVNAPGPGTGKSFLVDLAAAMVLGDRTPCITAGRDSIELDKRLTMAALAGWPIYSIDNVNGEIGGDLLCQLVERPRVALRRLGSSAETVIENHACIYATGNNLTAVGDLVRRVVRCNLDARMEHPELRQFPFDPCKLILADRGKFIAAALIVVRAYHLAGCPGELLPVLGSFEDWSRLVRSALVWLGHADPLDTQAGVARDDPGVATLWALLHSWQEACGRDAWLTTADLVQCAQQVFGATFEHVELRDALLAATNPRDNRLNVQSVVRYLNSHADRPIDGKLLKKKEGRFLRWRVEDLA